MAKTDILDPAGLISGKDVDVTESLVKALRGKGKRTAVLNSFHGGLNTYKHKKDIDDNSFELANNIMVDKVGRIRAGGAQEENVIAFNGEEVPSVDVEF